jgi:hypothetical protein
MDANWVSNQKLKNNIHGYILKIGNSLVWGFGKEKVESSSIKVKYIHTNWSHEKGYLVEENFNWYQTYGCRIKHCIMNMSIMVKWSNVKYMWEGDVKRNWCGTCAHYSTTSIFTKLLRRTSCLKICDKSLKKFLNHCLKHEDPLKNKTWLEKCKIFNFTHPCI